MRKDNNNTSLLRYAGMATQFLVLIGAMVWLGIFLDRKFLGSKPLLVWVLPLLAISASIYKLIKDTSHKP